MEGLLIILLIVGGAYFFCKLVWPVLLGILQALGNALVIMAQIAAVLHGHVETAL